METAPQYLVSSHGSVFVYVELLKSLKCLNFLKGGILMLIIFNINFACTGNIIMTRRIFCIKTSMFSCFGETINLHTCWSHQTHQVLYFSRTVQMKVRQQVLKVKNKEEPRQVEITGLSSLVESSSWVQKTLSSLSSSKVWGQNTISQIVTIRLYKTAKHFKIVTFNLLSRTYSS